MQVISIVMPVFNAETWLGETLNSVKYQTYKNWELLAINDGSNDGSLAILNEFALEFPERVRIVTILNSGPSKARNLGIEMAEGKNIAFLDADDVWVPEKLATQMQWLADNPAYVACTCDFGIYRRNNLHRLRLIHFDWSQTTLLSWALLEGYGPGLCSTLLVKTQIAKDIGGFNEIVSNAEDTEFALRILKMGFIGSPRGELMKYRISESQNHTNLSTIIPGIESLMSLHPFVDNPTLQKRARSNAHALIALKCASNRKLLEAGSQLLRAFRTSPIAPLRLIWLTLKRKTFG